MDITLQLHDNECGVCVLNTFYKFFYGKDVKDELMNESKIEENGMSLYEFENLGTKYGIYSESYECTCGEIKELKHSNCFVVIVSNEKGNHYTIVKKHTRKIEFFDSVKGHYFLTYNEFERIFTGVCIFITKCERKNIIKKKYGQIFKHINFPYLIVSVLLEIFMVCIGIVSANYISIVISQNVNNSILTNVIFISIIFFTFFV
jgi:ABC-type bacteriocin/lantibiotic exporter with double-glycine peptidase domain